MTGLAGSSPDAVSSLAGLYRCQADSLYPDRGRSSPQGVDGKRLDAGNYPHALVHEVVVLLGKLAGQACDGHAPRVAGLPEGVQRLSGYVLSPDVRGLRSSYLPTPLTWPVNSSHQTYPSGRVGLVVSLMPHWRSCGPARCRAAGAGPTGPATRRRPRAADRSSAPTGRWYRTRSRPVIEVGRPDRLALQRRSCPRAAAALGTPQCARNSPPSAPGSTPIRSTVRRARPRRAARTSCPGRTAA